ncbi:MAG: PilZ domain-containing protein [Gammaproteobacteria bacterium]|nr:PilZ domain-containing protein [Gammaproteobacteria bacterium]
MKAQRQERRASPRVVLNVPVRFRAPDMRDFESGEVVNMSEVGFLIATPRQLVIGSRIQVSTDPDTPVDENIDVAATVVRFEAQLKLSTKEGDTWYWYGCQIEQIKEQAA